MKWGKKQQLVGYLFVLPNIIGVTVFFFIPALFTFVISFTNWKFTTKTANFVGWANFQRLFQDEVFYEALRNTFVFLLSVPVSVVLAFFVALLLNKQVYLKNWLRAMYFLPYITSGVAVAFVWMLLFDAKNGPINQFLRSVGVANPPGWFSTTTTPMLAYDIIWIWLLLGYNMIIYLAALQEVPKELLEAAKMDGAKARHTIRHVILPLVSPTTFFLLLTGFVVTVKAFGIMEAVTHGGPGTSSQVLSLYVYKTAFRYYEMGYASTISIVLFVFILLITLFQWYGQKKWVHY
ncbi:carbohydrate ABC transporter permease [Paenibacillus allorhizosphaerae]|uniref:Lactose transport system permease protein LacF n=1 Tax=Paenibacillus allorhizosphaerae TaxID=2849866 RepID=A0ABM8VJF7_9BACL|nr:sugar ABC transporter permease [Paenibacillus allorhizosphaerae]CAG7645432.1 Lactose transport system permease protein LacF [Paenibacillus allorhizosphaerae]